MNQANGSVNEHVEQYLDDYCGAAEAPGFAVLLKGEWGCGKTWFIKQYREKKGKDKFLYVSLYGVTSFADIEYEFFRQVHPVLGSKKMELAGKIFKGVIKTTLSIDLNNDGKSDASVIGQVPDIDLPQYLKGLGDRVIIFDDLERCKIELIDLMGYINSLVEHQDAKVIILANEDELQQQAEDYTRIKEKLIGQTIEIKFDFKGAFDSFLPQDDNDGLRGFLILQGQKIEDIYEYAKYKNLRILKQVIFDFKRIHSNYPKKYRGEIGALEKVLKILTIFS